jgi:hypothetical protein
MSEGAGPVPATTPAGPCAAGPDLDRLRRRTSVRGRSVASAIDALRPSAADGSRRRAAHAQRLADILARERAARLAPAETR